MQRSTKHFKVYTEILVDARSHCLGNTKGVITYHGTYEALPKRQNSL